MKLVVKPILFQCWCWLFHEVL